MSLLGRFHLQCGDEEPALAQTVQRIVAYLALAGETSRPVLAERLWPDLPTGRALNSLRSALNRLERHRLGLLLRRADLLRLSPSISVDVDEVLNWTRLLLTGTGSPIAPPPAAVTYRDLLPGWDEDWVAVEREHVRQLLLHALERYAEHLTQEHQLGEALHLAYTVLRADPLRESSHRVVIGVHLAAGNVVEAVRHYEAFKVRLLAELGIRPTEQITALIRAAAAVPSTRRDSGR